MESTVNAEIDTKQEKPKRAKVSQTEFPGNTLVSALRIPEAIWENFAGKSAPPHEIAVALNMSPTSGGWRNLCGSAIAYGLTEGGYAANDISLTELGRRIVAPTEEGDDVTAKVEALLKPRILRDFFEKYDRAKFPKDEIAKNVLVSMRLPKERADTALEILKANGKYTGVIMETKTGPFVTLGSPAPVPKPQKEKELASKAPKPSGVTEPAKAQDEQVPPPGASQPDEPKQIFVAHGKNQKPLQDLKKILDQFKIPYKIAVDEPHTGRPISKKVAELMRGCSAGIFIFTRDEKSQHEGDLEVWRPSENVVYELGAASILWENKIIILKEKGVSFPSDFSDLGYITFEDGKIANKALDLLKELVALQLVRVQAA